MVFELSGKAAHAGVNLQSHDEFLPHFLGTTMDK
jgi:hypothetical protein